MAHTEKSSPGLPSKRLLRSIRGTCNSPDGYSREEARDMYRQTAYRLEMRVDELIDAAMGASWSLTQSTNGRGWALNG